jgi:hypothetical protein
MFAARSQPEEAISGRLPYVCARFLRSSSSRLPMMTDLTLKTNPQVPPENDAAIVTWMANQGWKVAPARWETDPEAGFHVWQETDATPGKSHALWIDESMVRRLSAEQLVDVLDSEGIADEIRFSYKIRIQERGDGYRVSIVSRRSGEWKKQE